ncbi:hypothetical protein O4H25_14240, partial [Staphylococcus equorum]|uniref:hypothetical protein n=1 Tax=Staphylococcus equorum TaxID=246432 RepID=UPI0022AFC339
QIPIVARLRPLERGQLGDVENLYIYSTTSPQKVPLRQVSPGEYGMNIEKIRRRDHQRTITVSAFPVPGKLPSEVMKQVHPKLDALMKT